MIDIEELLWAEGVITLAVVDNSNDAVPLAEALLAGGLTVVEVALRTDQSLGVIDAITRESPTMKVLAGTVLTKAQARQAADAGAVGLVSPGFSRDVSLWCAEHDVPYIPGVSTASEIMTALDNGHRMLKFFPSAQLGGLSTLGALAAPFTQHHLSFMMTGGMRQDDLRQVLTTPFVAAVGGSWIAPRKEVESGSWDSITGNALAARQIVTEVRAEQETK